MDASERDWEIALEKSPSSRAQCGVSLLEVLVAIVIFSVGLLGLALMQLKGAQFTKKAGARTVAILQSRSLADAMRVNPAGVFGVSNANLMAAKNGDVSASYYKYTGGTSDAGRCGDDPCRVAAADITNWITQISAVLAVPVGTVGIAMTMKRRATPARQRGFSLVEMMIAVVLVAWQPSRWRAERPAPRSFGH